MPNEEKAMERRMRLKAMAGVMDFFGVIGCAILIVALIALLANLSSWLVTDLTQSFSELQKSVSDALLVQSRKTETKGAFRWRFHGQPCLRK